GHAVTDVTEHHAERGGGLALAGAGIDDQKTLLADLGRHDLVARRLVLARLFGMACVLVRVVGAGGGHAAVSRLVEWGRRSASRLRALLERGVHRPRRIASSKRAAVSFNAAGL